MTAPATIAHRAGNSYERLEQALAAGLDAVEIDVRIERGRLVGRHDARVSFLPLYYERWRLYFSAAAAALLEKVLERVGNSASLLLDVKSAHARDLRLLLETVKAHGPLAGMRMSSPFWDLMRDVQASEPELRVYYSIGNPQELARFWERQVRTHEAKGVSIKEGLLDEALTRRFLSEGVEIAAYNVHDLRRARGLASRGVAAIISGDYSMLRALKESPIA